MDRQSIEHFSENMMKSHISKFDRGYLYRIMHDNCFMGELTAFEFIELVLKNLVEEDNVHVLPWLMLKTSKIIGYNLDSGINEYPKLLLKKIEEKLEKSLDDMSMRNILIDNYIAQCDPSNQAGRAILVEMIKCKKLLKFPHHENVINKSQRYMAIRKLVRNLKPDQGIPPEIQDMIDAERKINFSAADEVDMIKIEACIPGMSFKNKLWDKYVHATDNLKQ